DWGKTDVPPPEIPEPQPQPPIEVAPTYSAEALHISDGEGWYQTFKEMGVSAEDRPALLKLVGPKLKEMGIGYTAPDLGGYGMYMTADAKMPQSVLDYIHQTAVDKGYLKVPTAPSPVDIAAPSGADVATAHVGSGYGGSDMLNIGSGGGADIVSSASGSNVSDMVNIGSGGGAS